MSASAMLPDLADLLAMDPYGLPAADKAARLGQILEQLTAWHREHCPPYQRMLTVLGEAIARGPGLAAVPFLPVRVFKDMDLSSVDPGQVVKTLTSSGTSGQAVSRIYLDRETAALQSKVLARLMASLLGQQRHPMLVIDTPSVLKDRTAFSARGAGILGFSLFGRDVTYALDDNMQLDLPRIDAFLEKHRDAPRIFLFGFTYMVWRHLVQPLATLGRQLPLERGVLLHGGGWKKLADEAVPPASFRAALAERCGLERVVDYYGMVEQTGSIHLACGQGHLHAPVFSDVVMRDPRDFAPLPPGRRGLIEVLSVLPRSYPGHALLTDDLGTLRGEDDCPCGRLGRYFTVEGRAPRAEARGCSDTYAAPG
ncbi:MAG: acyl-protein synthetase [Rhodocyclaceae bacterium]|nr:acyl-protein synthetase [Rhodocyclaceae bacterium]